MANETDFTAEEKGMFEFLKVAADDTGLKNLIRAQRKLNGALCKADWAILDALEHQVTGRDPSGKGRSLNEVLTLARTLSGRVAMEPPGCDPRDPRS